jgi:ATP-dependent RNA helicase DeaD
MLVLDEADEMLSMGFYPDMRQLKRYLPRERQGAMFSATMPYQVQRVGKEFLTNPGFLAMAGGQIHVDLMAHRAYAVDAMGKDRALLRLIEMENPTAALIFANRRTEVEYLTRFLQNSGYDADGISSDLTQKAREEVMGRLRSGRLRLLIATDVAARGIDVPDLSHVFQYDVPQDREYYVHRAGRTARAGKAGVSIALVTRPEQPVLKEIASRYDLPLEWRDVPSDQEVAARVGERVIVLLEDQLRERSSLERERLARFVPVVRDLVSEGEPELLAMLLDEVYQRARHAAPLSEPAGSQPDQSEPDMPDEATADAAPEPKRRRGRSRKSAEDAEGDALPAG